MLNEKTFMRIFLASAAYDAIVTFPLATPWTYHLFSDTMRAIHEWSGVTGIWPAPAMADTFFASLTGSIVLVWAAARLFLKVPALARFDAVGRILFSTWMIYALANGMSGLLIVYLVIELSFGILQLLPYRKTALEAP